MDVPVSTASRSETVSELPLREICVHNVPGSEINIKPSTPCGVRAIGFWRSFVQAFVCRRTTPTWKSRSGVCLSLLIALGSLNVFAVTDKELDNRLANVERLVESSSGARRVEGSNQADAMLKRDQARELLRQARSAKQAGDSAKTQELLKQASQRMFEAVRMVGTPSSVTEKHQRDFEARIGSVTALREALSRIAAEKGSGSSTQGAIAEVDGLLGKARAAQASGDMEAGWTSLNAAYDRAKREVESLRGGETLVRSLTFENPEAEYRYEVDRNDTHRMLLDVLAQESASAKSSKAMVDKFVARAAELRQEAEAQAARGDHAQAVKVLEQSTKELIRAIRSTGVYIPG